MVRFFRRNGVRLAYADTGQSTRPLPAMVLIHGWADRHELLAPIAAHYRSRYRVLSVDLRGHGQSDKPKDGYQIPTLADDVVSLCREAGLKRFTLVGHSLGGAVSLEIAARYPQMVSSVTAIEGAILFTSAAREWLRGVGKDLRGPGWKKTMEAFIDSCYLPGDDPALRRYSYRELERIPQHVHVGICDGVTTWDAERPARACKAPLLYIEGGIGICDLARLKSLCPQLVVGRTVGLSHMQIVATPEQPLAMIDRFLEIQKTTKKA
jgi:pimeloyl-ACP methyl ester carboxylesterase